MFSSEDIAIYALDAAGVKPDARGEPSNGNPTQDTLGGPSHAPDGMELARRSGGRFYTNMNNLEQAIGDAANDTRTLYSIGFYADPEGHAGQYHSIKLGVNRPGVQLRYRPGYYDEDRSRPKKADDRARIVTAIASPVDSSAVPVSARIERGSSRRRLRISVNTPLEGYAPGETARTVRSVIFELSPRHLVFKGQARKTCSAHYGKTWYTRSGPSQRFRD
jgi:hypothetical protein